MAFANIFHLSNNFKCWQGLEGIKGGNEAIRNLLTYIQNSKGNSVTDAVTQELHEYVSRVKVRSDVREEYMKFDEIIAYERRDEKADTKREDIIELLEEYGEIPGVLREQIENEQSMEVLKRWHKLAAKVETIAEFTEKM